MLKSIFFAAFAVVALAGSAQAARPDTRNLTCKQAVDFVRQNAPVVMTYGYSNKAGSLYSMFYADATSCRLPHDEHAQPAWVPTLDSPSCFVGYTCNN